MRLTSSLTENSTEHDQMNTATINAQAPKVGGIIRKGHLYLLALLLLIGTVQPVKAATVTIGKGSGILWEGLPYNATLSGPMGDTAFFPHRGMLNISLLYYSCTTTAELTNIGGYMARQIAPGVGLVPRANVSASYVRYDGRTETLTGTLGLPKTEGITSTNKTVKSWSGYEWCLPASNGANDSQFFSLTGDRTAKIAGTWVLVADGTQVNSEITLPQLLFSSFSSNATGSPFYTILPGNITLRISTLECTVSTPTMINFGSVERLTQAGAELATYSSPMMTACSQDADKINANINLQFRALTSLYENQPTRLALAQGGGYITGEINNGVTGSGVCTGTSGLPFDNSVVKIGNILATEAATVINNQVTWRLCSGGASLPVGNVNASAEMLVTFN